MARYASTAPVTGVTGYMPATTGKAMTAAKFAMVHPDPGGSAGV